MSSIIKMFKSKKSSNKENNPINRSSLERASTRSDMNTAMNRSINGSDIYTGNHQRPVHKKIPHEIHVANPYSTVTAPKKTKGTRSCPGAPIDERSERDRRRERILHDRYLQPHQLQYMNGSLRSDRGKRLEFVPSDRSSEYGSADPSPIENRHNRRYLEDLLESDDEAQEQRMRMLESEISKVKRERRYLNEKLASAMDEIEYYRRSADRIARAYAKAKTTIENERAEAQRIRRELMKSNARVAELEDRIADSGNDSSLLMCSYSIPTHHVHSGMGDSTNDGAGEALCSLNEQHNDVISVNSHSIPGLRSESQNDDLGEDEVRVFRKAECETPPLERPRRSSEERVLSRQPTTSTLNGNIGLGLRRTLSDTDLSKVSSPGRRKFRELNGNEMVMNETEVDDSVDKATDTQRRLEKCWDKEPYIEMLGDSTSDDSEDDTYAILERQLRKRGEVVKFQPPRQQIAAKHFRRFGRSERTALAEFEYLQEIPTDVSGMLSSPDGTF